MGDLCDTQEILLSPEVMYCDMLSEEERAANGTSKYSHTDCDNKGLGQFEGVANPDKRL